MTVSVLTAAPANAGTHDGTSFVDVDADSAFFKEISWLASEEISRGWKDGTFRPLEPINRDAMAAFMYRFADEPAYSAPAKSRFKDVQRGDPFYKEISWLASEEISRGWKDGTFRPLEPINRDAMAAFMYRFADEPAYSAPAKSRFKDVQRGDTFYKEISWLASEEISRGWKDGTFRPLEPINRDAMAAFMYRLAAVTAPSLSEQRADLREEIKAAKQEYVDARPYVPLLARVDGLAVQGAVAEGIVSLDAAASLVTAATTQPSMSAASEAVNREHLRASTVRKSAARLKTIKELRGVQQDVARKALSDRNTGRIGTSMYKATKARAAAFSTLLAADSVKQLNALGKARLPAKLEAARWRDELEGDSGSIPSAPGWEGFPGGCALPVANPAFTPSLPSNGPGVATNSHLIAEAKVRGESNPSLADVHERMLRAASSEASETLTLNELRNNYLARVARLGYGTLEANNIAARDALRADAKRIIAAGPESMNTLTSSHLLMAVATASDWSEARGMEETVLIRWLGPQTCLHADQENFVDAGTNIAAIHNSATFVAAAVFLEHSPAQAAAMARESLVSIQPALDMITTDGGTQEGPSYWSYQSRALATLYSTLPNVYETNPIAMPSLEAVSNYAMNSTGPDGLPTPFADARPDKLVPWMPAWDAYSRNDPAVAAWVARERAKAPDAYLMWWWSKPGSLPSKQSTAYPQTGLAALHLPEGASTGTATLKGGDNSANHAHLDLGTVSYHRNGVQWAVDPGKASVYPPGYFGDTRWSFWRPSTEAHSTLLIGQADQPVTAKASISLLSPSTAAVDMVEALPGTSSATRTVVHTSTSMIIKDVVRAKTKLPFTWQWVTDASVSLDTDLNCVTMRKSGQMASIRFQGVPDGATLTAVEAPENGPSGEPLTVIRLTMPNVSDLNLTATVR